MSPPPQRACYVAGCEYWTVSGLPNHDLIIKDLELHIRCAHAQLTPASQNQTGQSQASGLKADRLPRPTIGEGISEADWRHFNDKWSRYKRSALAGASAEQIGDQLWACCEADLERSVYNTGLDSNSSEEQLLATMKNLAVKAQNTLVNVVKFFDMTQEQEESAGSFTARLKGQAASCGFAIKCTSKTCNQLVEYSENMVCH